MDSLKDFILSESNLSKEKILEKYAKLSNDIGECKQLHETILGKLEIAVKNDELKKFEHLSTLISYISESENYKGSTVLFTDDSFLNKTNLIIFASKNESIDILTYILNNLDTIPKLLTCSGNTILPNDQDETGHNAFYYGIRSGKIELLKLLIDSWPNDYFKVNQSSLDDILLHAYQELKLRNIQLSEDVELYIQETLISLRFFSDSLNKTQKNKNPAGDVQERIFILFENIRLLEEIDKVNEKFLVLTRHIAQNIYVLKRLLKCTYDKLPWEEMEFCLLSFICSQTNIQEISIFYQGTLDRKRLLTHLKHFSKQLEKVNYEIENLSASQLSTLPKTSRDNIVSKIINNDSQFKDLYDDYHQIRDIRSLNKISKYIELAVNIDPSQKEGQLIITRSLQVMGEYLKNTLESPKLSTFTSERLLLSLQENTRKIIVSLRNSLSHAYSLSKRIDIEKNCDVAFFTNVQEDVKKIGYAVDETLYRCKGKVIKEIFEKLVDCEDLDEMKRTYTVARKCDMESIMKRQASPITDIEKLEKLIADLKSLLNDTLLPTFEAQTLNKMVQIVKGEKNKIINQAGNYALDTLSLISGFYLLPSLNSENSVASFKRIARDRQRNMISLKTESISLKELVGLSLGILHSPNLETVKFDEVQRKVYEIIHIAESVDNIDWINELSEMLMKKCIDQDEESSSDFRKFDYEKYLLHKLTELNSILDAHALNNSFEFSSSEHEGQLRVILEMLILDILSILGTDKDRLENNLIVLENVSILVGKSLRNHLAHDNLLIEILQPNLSTTLISNARKLVKGNISENKRKIGRVVNKSFSEGKTIFQRELEVIDNQLEMFSAIERGDLDGIAETIKKGADIFARNVNLWTTLHFAAKSQNLDVVKFLIDNGVNMSCKNTEEQSPLHIAAQFGNCKILEWFLKNKSLNVDDMDASEKAPLHYAAQSGHLSTVKMLLKYKANIYAKDKVGFTPFHYSVEWNHKDVVELFLSSGHDVNKSEAPGGFTPLHIAAEHGHLDLVDFLLARGANAHAKIDRKATALHLSASEGHLEIVNVLLSKGVEVNEKNLDGRTPLYSAVSRGHEQLVRVLLENGADPNTPDDIDSSAPLHPAVFGGYENIVKDLLKHGANPNAATTSKITPFHVAIQCGRAKIAELLLENGVDLNCKVFAGSLGVAVKEGNYDMVELLLKNNFNVNEEEKTLKNWKLVHYAAWKGEAAVFELLLGKNANINVRDENDSTPLHIAAGNGHKEIVELLLEKNMNVNSQDKFGLTPLHNAAMNGKFNVVKLLLKCNAKVNMKNNENFTPLHLAVMRCHRNIICLLIENGADVNVKCYIGQTVLHIAAASGYKEIVKLLLKNNANTNIKDDTERTPFLYAIEKSQKDIVDIFIKNGADVHADGGKPLLFAVKSKNKNIINLLLRQKAVVNTTFAGNLTLLHLAIRNGDEEATRILIDNGIDVNCRANFDNDLGEVTPLLLAAEFGYHKVAEILLQKGANVNFKDRTGATPLHVAVVKGFSRVVEILLKYNANLHVRDREGRTAFEFAVSRDRLQCVKAFLQKENIDLNEKGTSDFTILHIATQEGLLKMVKFLVEKGANMHAKNNMNSKPIHIAARDGHKDLVEYFLDQGMNVEEPGTDNKPPLHYAVSTGQIEILDYLLERGANINGKDCNGLTSVHIAVYVSQTGVLRRLLKKGAFYNYVSDFQRFKPIDISRKREITDLLDAIDNLFNAVKANDIAQVQRSISAGAIVNAKNTQNVTPLHYAAWKGFKNTVEVLLGKSANPNAAGKNGITPLHYAAQFSHLAIVKSLLMHGAMYNVLSENGKAPANVATDQNIVDLFKSIESAFKKIEEGNADLLMDLKMMDTDMRKLIMSVVNAENKTLVAHAILKKYPHVDKLKDTTGNDSADLERAEILRSLNKLQEAMKIYEKLLKRRTNSLGPNNPATLDISYEIALTLFKQQKFDESLSMLRETHAKQASILEECNEVTLNTKSKLAYLLHEKGQSDEALRLYREIYAKQKEILTADDENLMSTELHMALVLDALGKYDEALKINRNLYEKHKKKLGAHDPNSLIPLNNIALVLLHQSNYDEALEIYQEVYEARKKIMGSSHEYTLRTLRSTANVYHLQKKYDKAMKIYEDVFEKQKKLLGQGHLDTLNTQQAMAKLCLDQGKLPTALKMYNDYLATAKAILGINYPDIKAAEFFISTIKMAFQSDGSSHLIDIVLKNAKK